MKGVKKKVLELTCNDMKVNLDLNGEKLSMLVVGGSRMGKTYFASLLAQKIICDGDSVHLLDLGTKWGKDDKERMCSSGIKTETFGTNEVRLFFDNYNDLAGCGQFIANGLGFRSMEVRALIKDIFKNMIREHREDISFTLFLNLLKNSAEENDWARKLLMKLDGFTEPPNIRFVVDEGGAKAMADTPTIWDLSYVESELVTVIAYMVLYSLFCIQRNRFRKKELGKKVFSFIDEFQNLDCNQNSIIGKCLTEGQKSRLYLVLITQFLQDKFSDAVLHQLKQSGFQIYFRLTEEEASVVSRQLLYNYNDIKLLQEKLTSLPRGSFLLKGPHKIGSREESTEQIRFVDVHETAFKKRHRVIIISKKKSPISHTATGCIDTL